MGLPLHTSKADWRCRPIRYREMVLTVAGPGEMVLTVVGRHRALRSEKALCHALLVTYHPAKIFCGPSPRNKEATNLYAESHQENCRNTRCVICRNPERTFVIRIAGSCFSNPVSLSRSQPA